MSNHKRGLLLILLFSLVFIVLCCLFLHVSKLSPLTFLEEDAPIRFADSYMGMTAVVAQDGNVYIRGSLVSDKYTYAIPDTDEYNRQYRSLNVWKTDRYVQIYNRADASQIKLSFNGGAILTQNNELYVFCDLPAYQYPVFLRTNTVSAVLYNHAVYALSADGELTRIDLSSSEASTLIAGNILSFCITDYDGSIWTLNSNHELHIFPKGDISAHPILLRSKVLTFDVDASLHTAPHSGYRLGLIDSDGNAFYYNSLVLPTQPMENLQLQQLSFSPVEDIAVYAHGCLIKGHDNNVRAYGTDLFTRTEVLDGEIIANNVQSITAGSQSVSIITYDYRHLFAGTTPSSCSIDLRDFCKD